MNVRSTLRPVETTPYRIPAKMKRIAVALTHEFDVTDVAWLFGVAQRTVSNWRKDAAEGRL